MGVSLWSAGLLRPRFVLGAALCLVLPIKVQAQAAAMADLSLEELADIEIVSVSRRLERLQDAPASIFVITNADIRRSSATTLPEALRLAPNLNVAQITASSYAISARGFNNSLGNKLLVLIDGRTVYSPIFSGVNWDTQQVMLEDIERIEVISGPGGTMWGANAVNGVINVITKRSSDSQGGIVVGTGTNNNADGNIRYGGKLAGGGHYRIYGMGQSADNTHRANGTDVLDGWTNRQAGFRADWGTTDNGMTVQGDAYETRQDSALGKLNQNGMNILARLNRQLEGGSQLRVQAYYDRAKRDATSVLFSDDEETYDLEFQHGFELAEKHRILWGGGTRYTRSDTEAGRLGFTLPAPLPPLPAQFVSELLPADRGLHWSNLFVQDEIALTDAVALTLGIKAERNSYTGMEFLPSARLAWKPDDKQLVWSALSRVVRAPARIDRDFNLSAYLSLPPAGPAGDVRFAQFIVGGPNFRSEVADVLEVGYRAQPSSKISYSVTAYYNEYDYLRSGGLPPAEIQNMMEGRTYGAEAWGNYQATPDWRLSGGFTVYRDHFKLKPGSRDPDGATDAGNDPSYTWMLRSLLNLTSKHDLDIMVRRVAELPNPVVPAYTAVDARLSWRMTRDLELALIGQNLLDRRHPEFGAAGTWSEIGRRVGLRARWAF
jgi:iron complex outermembrane recepter protein